MLILILAAFLVLLPRIAYSECVDYGDYMQWLGRGDTPDWEQEIAISGTRAYVVTMQGVLNGTSALRVVDLSNPASPTLLGSVNLPGDSYSVAVSGPLAYVANANAGLRVIDVSNPTSPTIIGTLDTPGVARGVALSGTLVYVADALSGLQVIDVSNPTSPTIIGAVDTPNAALDVAVWQTTAYVADGGSGGLQVIDVSNPMSPQILGSADTPGPCAKVAVYGTVALIADDYAGLAVIDVSNPSSPILIEDNLSSYGGIYDVAISQSGGAAFLATGRDGLVTIDITNPASLGWLGNIEIKGSAWTVAVSSGLACVGIRNDGGQEQYSGIEVFDASNPHFPPILGYLPGQNFLGATGYMSVAIDGTRAYTTGLYPTATCPYPNPPCQSKLTIFDTSSLSPPLAALLGTVNTPGRANGVVAFGTKAYVADGFAGLEIVDVSNPSVPQIIGNANTPDEAFDVAVSGSMAYVADGNSGLQIIDVSNPSAPVIVKAVDTPGYASSVAVSGSLACVVDGASGLRVIDLTLPMPKLVGSVDTPGNAIDVAMSGSLAFVTDDDPGAGFQVISLSNPHSPTVLATLDLPGIANGIALTGSIAYVADGAEGLQIIDVSNPNSPVIVGTELVSTPQDYRKIATSGEFACVTNPSHPIILPLYCLTPPVLENPGTQNGSEHAYFSMTVTATDADQWGLTMSPVGSLPAWATFTDQGGGIATLTGVPQSGQAGTYPISIRASDDQTMTTVSFSIVIAPAGQVGVDESASPRFRLVASPNPFQAELDLEFSLERKAQASVVILDLQGRKVRDLVSGEFPAGIHRTSWGGQDDRGQPLGTGLYFARLTSSDGRVQVQKLFKIR